MAAKHPKRPRDTAQLAKFIVDLATGETTEPTKTPRARKAAKAGKKGGRARAKTLTPEQRSEIAHLAATARWKKG
jgi:hypothetical protein